MSEQITRQPLPKSHMGDFQSGLNLIDGSLEKLSYLEDEEDREMSERIRDLILAGTKEFELDEYDLADHYPILYGARLAFRDPRYELPGRPDSFAKLNSILEADNARKKESKKARIDKGGNFKSQIQGIEKANCAGLEPDLFFPDAYETGLAKEAMEVCKGCPIREECLEFALVNAIKFGIWGGTTRDDRKRIRKQRALQKARSQVSLAVSEQQAG